MPFACGFTAPPAGGGEYFNTHWAWPVGGSDLTRLRLKLKKPHLCFWLCHKKRLVVAVPSAWIPEPGKQSRATPSNSQSTAVTLLTCRYMNESEHWAVVWFLMQQSLTDTALYPLCFSRKETNISRHLQSVFTYTIIFTFSNVLWGRHSLLHPTDKATEAQRMK